MTLWRPEHTVIFSEKEPNKKKNRKKRKKRKIPGRDRMKQPLEIIDVKVNAPQHILYSQQREKQT